MTTDCFTVATPAFLYVSGFPDVETNFSPNGFLPAGLPDVSVLVSAWEATCTITSDMTGNVVWFGNANTTITDSVDGTWSLLSGTTVTDENVDYWEVDDWGVWLTEYLSFGTGASTNDAVSVTGMDAYYGSSAFDVQVRAKTANWDSCSTEGNTFMSSGGAFGVAITRTTSGIWAWVRYNKTPSGQGNINTTSAWSNFGFTDGTWEWLRVTGDSTNGIRFWTGSPGSWSVVDTVALPGDFASFNSWDDVKVGNGLLASSILGRGFNGDISDFTLSDSVGGTPLVDLNLAGATSSADTAWPSVYAEPDWAKGSNVTHAGAVGGTVTIHFDFTTPTRLDEFVAVFAPFAGGLDVDTWCLWWELPPSGGWKLGWL